MIIIFNHELHELPELATPLLAKINSSNSCNSW